jgi:hypothetical protein
MKTLMVFALFTLNVMMIKSQESASIDSPLGLRIKRNGIDYIIYADKKMSPDFTDTRKLNYKVYYRKVQLPSFRNNGKTLQMITVPGNRKELNQGNKSIPDASDPLNGKSISSYDYDCNFWIDSTYVTNFSDLEYYKYANEIISGLLTCPFKYRPKTGSTDEAFIDGGFNVAPFIGWKFRISSKNPYYVAPTAFVGVTTLTYTSSDNTGITDTKQKENGSGFTYGVGVVLRLGKISPGIVLGYDHGLGNYGKTFIYSDHPWFSFSVNYDFFEPSKSSTGNQ